MDNCFLKEGCYVNVFTVTIVCFHHSLQKETHYYLIIQKTTL